MSLFKCGDVAVDEYKIHVGLSYLALMYTPITYFVLYNVRTWTLT